MSSRIYPSLLVLFLFLGLAGCNFPLSRSSSDAAGSADSSATLAPGENGQTPGDFNPLSIDCLVGAWEVDSASLLSAGNMLIAGTGVTLTSVSPYMYYRVSKDGSLQGSSYTMQTLFSDVLISGTILVGDSEHSLELVLSGSTTAYFSAGAAAGAFDYQNDPENTTVKISKLKMDGLPMPASMIPLDDLIASIPSSTMYYSCQSADLVTLRDQNAADPVTLRRVSDASLPAVE